MAHFMREATVGYLVQHGFDEGPSLTIDEIRDIEIGVFNTAIQYATQAGVPCSWKSSHFRLIYDSKARSAVSNVDPRSYIRNEAVLRRIKAGEMLPHEVSTLPRGEVFPERWSSVMEMKKQRDVYLSTARPIAMTDQYKCKRCKKRECSFVELQTRSCDEPATLFIQCVQCGNRWRIG